MDLSVFEKVKVNPVFCNNKIVDTNDTNTSNYSITKTAKKIYKIIIIKCIFIILWMNLA